MEAESQNWPAPKSGCALVSVVLFFAWILLRPFSAELEQSLAGWTWLSCNKKNGFLHCRFVPFLFLGMVWWWSCLTRGEKVRPSYRGLFWLILGMMIYWVGVRIVQPRVALVSIPFLIVGLTHYCLGGKVARMLSPSAFFLLFLIPLPGLSALMVSLTCNFELQMTAAIGSWFGIEAFVEGTSLSTKNFDWSWGRSLNSSGFFWMMVGSAMVIFYQGVGWRRWALFLAIFPIIGTIRIGWRVLLLILWTNEGESRVWADRLFFGDLGTVLRFFVLVGLMLLAAWLLEKVKPPVFSPPCRGKENV